MSASCHSRLNAPQQKKHCYSPAISYVCSGGLHRRADVDYLSGIGDRRSPAGRVLRSLLAIPAWGEVATIDRLRQERCLVVGPELTDMRIDLDDGVPQLVLVVAE
jgi:hypothetical protein